MRKPFFSIVVPTFNRKSDLKRAVHCILQQDFKDFEIIVADNNSTDNIKSMLHDFKSNKIIYFKNKKNIGWIPNFTKGMKIARGKYVMLHGDDDFLVDKSCLRVVHSLLKKNAYGFIRLNFLKLSYNKKRIFDYYKKIFEDLKIGPKQKSEDIVDFLTKAELNFISGVMYKNYKNAYKDVFPSELGPWFLVLHKCVSKSGGYLLSKHYLMTAWSRPSGSFYVLVDGRFKFERYYDEISKLVNKEYYKYFLKAELKPIIMVMPAAKLHTSFKNLLNYAKRIIDLSPDYKYSFIFWLYFFLSLLMPKFILRFIRAYKEGGHNTYKIPEYNKILQNVQRITLES